LDIFQKILAPLGKLFAPPCVPSWLRVWFKHCVTILLYFYSPCLSSILIEKEKVCFFYTRITHFTTLERLPGRSLQIFGTQFQSLEIARN